MVLFPCSPCCRVRCGFPAAGPPSSVEIDISLPAVSYFAGNSAVTSPGMTGTYSLSLVPGGAFQYTYTESGNVLAVATWSGSVQSQTYSVSVGVQPRLTVTNTFFGGPSTFAIFLAINDQCAVSPYSRTRSTQQNFGLPSPTYSTDLSGSSSSLATGCVLPAEWSVSVWMNQRWFSGDHANNNFPKERGNLGSGTVSHGFDWEATVDAVRLIYASEEVDVFPADEDATC